MPGQVDIPTVSDLSVEEVCVFIKAETVLCFKPEGSLVLASVLG